jgi:serine protease Do
MDSKMRDFRRQLRTARVFAVLMALALAGVIGFSLRKPVLAQEGQQRAQLPAPSDLSRAFIGVAKQVEPAVVNIDIVEKPKTSSKGSSRQFQVPGFRGFPGMGDGRPQAERGTGSGVIISADGYILTNNHVAGEADTMHVTLGDGREFSATRVGTDPETDLALIKIKAPEALPYARLGNSDDVQQGEWVVALGSPFGLKQTMTAGIISAVGRSLGGNLSDYIQTDASINPGNSGGPLVNMAGEVIGINDMILTSSGGNEGVGFAIPANTVNKVYAQLLKNGKVVRGYLGVLLQPVDQATAHVSGYDKHGGALVADLADTNAPAAKAGLQSGDVIVEFDGKPVASPSQLTGLVADEPVGKTVQVKYFRDGRLQTTSLKLSERPSKDQLAQNGQGSEGDSTGKLGVQVSNVTPDIAGQLKISSGAVVQSVDPGSPADNAGIQPGDVIHKINNTRVSTTADLTRAIRSVSNDQQLVLQVERQGTGGSQLSFVTVTLD